MAKNIAVIFTNSCIILKKADIDWVRQYTLIKKLLKGWRFHLLAFSFDCIDAFLQLY